MTISFYHCSTNVALFTVCTKAICFAEYLRCDMSFANLFRCLPTTQEAASGAFLVTLFVPALRNWLHTQRRCTV